MRVIMVASGNDQPVNEVSPFVHEQAMSLRKMGIEVEIFPIVGKGFWGYFKAIFKLNKVLNEQKFDIIHGHYLLAALVTIFQFRVPVVSSFIGCDINIPKNRILARLTVFKRSKAIIFVNDKLQKISGYKRESNIIPYGLDLNKFYTVDKQAARQQLQWPEKYKYIFFASRFDRIEKNAQLAFDAIEILEKRGTKIKLIEFRNIRAELLNFYYNASDLFILTSIREGSPQSIKEAMACNCPIISTDVGDVRKLIGSTEGCYITSFDPADIAEKLKSALEFAAIKDRTNGRSRIVDLGLDSETIAGNILKVYEKMLVNKI